jgi:hypothetical protein
MRKHNPYLRSLSQVACGLIIPLSAALAADFPAGAYTAHEHVTVTFDGKGQFRVSDGKATQVAGHYIVKGNQLELTDQEGPWACTKQGEQTGTYTWKYANSALTFTKVADHCEARVGTLATAPWKQPT